jgi:hypothetical protein
MSPTILPYRILLPPSQKLLELGVTFHATLSASKYASFFTFDGLILMFILDGLFLMEAAVWLTTTTSTIAVIIFQNSCIVRGPKDDHHYPPPLS